MRDDGVALQCRSSGRSAVKKGTKTPGKKKFCSHLFTKTIIHASSCAFSRGLEILIALFVLFISSCSHIFHGFFRAAFLTAFAVEEASRGNKITRLRECAHVIKEDMRFWLYLCPL